MYRILIVSEDFVLRKAVAFSLNDLDACVECADTVGAMLVLHRESPFDLVIVMGTAAEMCRFGRKLVRATVCRSFLPQAGCRAPRKVFEQRVVDALLRNRRVRSLSRGDVFAG